MSPSAATWVGADGHLLDRVIVVALGGNLGGIDAVQKRCESVVGGLSEAWGAACLSSFWVTAPIGEVEEQPDFLNAVAAWRPSQDTCPQRVLATLQALEQEHGRTRERKGGARTLDLDLLFVGRQTRSGAQLILPHPRLHLRAFVLEPLAELFGGELRLDAVGLSVATCLAAPSVAVQRIRRAL